jgi:DNA (cytosine-5)-methyltransferase 1
MDSRRGRLLGNAVVPPISEWLGRRILEIVRCS